MTKASFRAAILLTSVSKMAFVVRSVSRHAKLRGGLLMNPKTVKKALKDAIQAMTDYKWLFSARPGKDNTRNRKFPFQKVIPFILAFRGGTLNHEIMDFFGLDPSAGTSSAFIQRRSTILPEAFESLTEASVFLPLTAPICRLQPIPKTRIPTIRGKRAESIQPAA